MFMHSVSFLTTSCVHFTHISTFVLNMFMVKFLSYIQKVPGSSGVGSGPTSRKVAGSAPDGVMGIFHLH